MLWRNSWKTWEEGVSVLRKSDYLLIRSTCWCESTANLPRSSRELKQTWPQSSRENSATETFTSFWRIVAIRVQWVRQLCLSHISYGCHSLPHKQSPWLQWVFPHDNECPVQNGDPMYVWMYICWHSLIQWQARHPRAGTEWATHLYIGDSTNQYTSQRESAGEAGIPSGDGWHNPLHIVIAIGTSICLQGKS